MLGEGAPRPPPRKGAGAPPIPRPTAVVTSVAEAGILATGRVAGPRDALGPLTRQPLAPRARASRKRKACAVASIPASGPVEGPPRTGARVDSVSPRAGRPPQQHELCPGVRCAAAVALLWLWLCCCWHPGPGLGCFPLLVPSLRGTTATARQGVGQLLPTVITDAQRPRAGARVGRAKAAPAPPPGRASEVEAPLSRPRPGLPREAPATVVPSPAALLRPRPGLGRARHPAPLAWLRVPAAAPQEAGAKVISDADIVRPTAGATHVPPRLPRPRVPRSGHASAGAPRPRADAPCPTEARPDPAPRQDAAPLAAVGAAAVILVKVPSLALPGEAARLARHAAPKGRVVDAKALGPPSAHGRPLPHEAPHGA